MTKKPNQNQQEENIIDRGAEAVLIKEGNRIIKRRVKKGYRHKKLDHRLRKKRTRWEARNIKKAGKVNTPKILNVDEREKEIVMEFIKGERLSEVLNDFDLNKQKKIIKEIGKAVEEIHQENIIHGDLTTSNMILKNNKIYFIDFGLSFHSLRIEDKAVDLHLLKQALEAKHFQSWEELWREFKKSYQPKNKQEVLKRLKKVENRGRYK